MNPFERFIRFLGSLLDRITRYCWLLSGTAIVLMAFVIAYNVARRYAFNKQDPYAFVITAILMLVCVMFAIAYTQRQGQHIRVDFMDRYFPELLQGIMRNIVGPVIALICMGILIWFSWENTWFALQTGDYQGGGLVRVATWPSRMTVPFGAGLLALVLIAQMVRYLASFRKKAVKEKE